MRWNTSYFFQLPAFVSKATDLDKGAFEHELPLLDRHAMVYSFWLQVYHTLTKLKGEEKTSNLHILYTAGMSVTVEVRVGLSLGEAAAIEISEIRPPTGTESQRSSRRSEGSVGHRGTESAPMSAAKYPWKMNIVKLKNKLQQNN